ncbi:MAG: family 65 glycosyl hydrolase [Lachnospiraceae bacterium]|nr:family 65 glycosyl hydrolase [Lachnospiraceae bacterium]
MAKVADMYFQVDPWVVAEKGFDPEYSEVGESIFSLANEYMGIRGFFEEGYSGKSLTGSYFNGVYIRTDRGKAQYKGVSSISEFMVNSVNWLKMKITIDGEGLDLFTVKFSDFERTLDLKNGLLKRSFLWETESGKKTRIVFERFVSMKYVSAGLQRVTLEALNYSGVAEVTFLADFGIIHQATQQCYWEVDEIETGKKGCFSIMGHTSPGGQVLRSEHQIFCDASHDEATHTDEKEAGKTFVLQLEQNREEKFVRIVTNSRPGKREEKIEHPDFDVLLSENGEWWGNIWKDADIEIRGDEKNQQGIRFCIFQMIQTYHGVDSEDNIGAKGLTGEAYAGNTFWDTETYCLPFYMLNLPEAVESLLEYRYHTLDMARERAKALDCEGAFYPVSTISGRESCPLWQHASLQMQASTGVAYGIWFYENLSGADTEDFMKKYAAEMLVEISRMLATRGDFSADGSHYGYYCVMGPDEFQMMVNHNCYTNFMGRFTMQYTLLTLERLSKDASWYDGFKKKVSLREEELADWEEKAAKMFIPKKELLYEQHVGFFDLPHVDVDAIPVSDFPLYDHWSYDRLYRNDMIKQPDVLMLMLLFNDQFSEEEISANYEYYEPRTIHESSLSPSVHSILAAQIGKAKEAYDFFGFATRLDLDNYNRNTREGLHTTSIAAAWMNIVYGFGGVRTDGGLLKLAPTLPEEWEGYSFHLIYKEVRLFVEVQRERITITAEEGKSLTVCLYGEKMEIFGKTEVNR